MATYTSRRSDGTYVTRNDREQAEYEERRSLGAAIAAYNELKKNQKIVYVLGILMVLISLSGLEAEQDTEFAKIFWKSGFYMTIVNLIFIPLVGTLISSISYMIVGIGSDTDIGKRAFAGVWCGAHLFIFAGISALLSLFPTPCPTISLLMYMGALGILPTTCGYSFSDMSFVRALIAGVVIPIGTLQSMYFLPFL